MKTILLAGFLVLPLSFIVVYLIIHCFDQFGLLFGDEHAPEEQNESDVGNKQQ